VLVLVILWVHAAAIASGPVFGAEGLFVCNPFSSAKQGPVRLSDDSDQSVTVRLAPLATVRVDAAAKPLGGASPLENVYLVTSPRDGVCEIKLAGNDRGWVVDRNENGRPDFAGDRWVFDALGDGKAESVVEMNDENGDGTAETVSFYIGGSYRLSDKAKRAAEGQPIEKSFSVRTALEPDTTLGTPTARWFDKNGDGMWCRGSILKGGDISCDWVVFDCEHEIWHGRLKEIRHYDLDGDGDIDIRAFAGADSIQRGANIDGSDQAPNPIQTYDLLAGTGFYRWPPVDREAWRQSFGTFDMRKNTNTLLADLRRKYDLWMNMQDTPHGVIDVDGDGVRDVFVGVSVSGGPSDICEREEQPPAVWQTLERFFVGLAEPGQLNLNLDFNPLKRQRPDRDASLAIKTYRDRWGNELENFVGAFSPPADWNGKAVSAFDKDGRPADWMWLWDWHLTKPFKDLYVATWVKGWTHTGEGASVNIAMQDHRAEADFDCSTDFTVYYSPLINWFHLNGVEWGWWNIRNLPASEIKARFGALTSEYSLFPVNQFRYANEVTDTDLRRFYALSWACYFDSDEDGFVDTYLFDVDNNGRFDSRVWYDHARQRLLWAEDNTFREAPLKIEFPGQSLRLSNYRMLRDFYQRMMKDHRPLIDENGRVHVASGCPATPQAVVAVDSYHAGGAVVYEDKSRRGYSRLFTSISRRPVAVETLAQPFTDESLRGITHLILTDVEPQKAPGTGELRALDAWLKDGGQVLIVLPDRPQRIAAASALVERYGITCGNSEPVTEAIAVLAGFSGGGQKRLDYQRNKDGFLIDTGCRLSLSDGARPLLTWQPPEQRANSTRRARPEATDAAARKDVPPDGRDLPAPWILAAEARVGEGRVVVVAAATLLNNTYTAYRPNFFSPFDPRRLSNRRWMEEAVERLLPCGDQYARGVRRTIP